MIRTLLVLLALGGPPAAAPPPEAPPPAAPATAPAAATEPLPALPTVKELTEHLDRLYRSESSHARMTMKVTTRHFSRTLELEAWSKGTDRMLAVIRSPAREAGTATLKTDAGMWNYAPRADRLMRIPPGLLQESWMGSHFTNDDLMQENQYAEQYDTRIERQTLDGTAMLRLEMTPKPEAPVAYTRVDFFLTADRWLPVRAVYFEDADVVRTEHFRDVKTIGKRPIPMTIEVVPADKPGESTAGESTVVTYETLRFDVDVPERIFTPRGLRKAAHQR